MDLDDLVLAVLHGEPRAWNELGRRLTVELGPYFRKRFGDADANDLVQITLMIVARKLPEFEVRPGRPFLHWVRSIARIEAQEAYRQQRQQERLAKGLGEHRRSPSTNLGSRLDRARRLALVAEALEQLDSRYRRVIDNDLDEGDPGEFAEDERIKPGTVRTRRNRAHQQLRRLVTRKSTPTPP